MNVYLLGYRCSGKSSVGRVLAERLGRPFVDMDREIVQRAGKSIREIVSESGWDRFREMEAALVAELSGRNGLVVATGGGVVVTPGNIAAMKASGVLVWLQVTAETVRERMVKDTDSEALRPSLTGRPLLEEIQTTLARRLPLYRNAGDVSVDSNDAGIESICDTILRELTDRGRFG